MASFLLSASPPHGGRARSIAFEAADSGAALTIAMRHCRHRHGDLWCDGRLLCHIESPDETGGCWLIK